MKFQASVGNTTYTLEDSSSDVRFVRLSRSNPHDGASKEFFVPIGLVVEYVVARLAARVGQKLIELAKP